MTTPRSKIHVHIPATEFRPSYGKITCPNIEGAGKAECVTHPGLVVSVVGAMREHRRQISASGYQAHTTSPSATRLRQKASPSAKVPLVSRHPASTASRPTFVTMANAPLSGGMGEALGVICPTSQAKMPAADWHDGQIGLSFRCGEWAHLVREGKSATASGCASFLLQPSLCSFSRAAKPVATIH
jgi:hypothetical protein